MFRTRLGAALTAGALVATLTITSSGSVLADDRPSKQFERIDLNTVQLAGGFKPASLAPDRKVTVILELAGASVSRRSAEAKKQGRELSKAERDAIRASLKSNQDALRGRVAATGASVLFDYQDAYNGLAVRAPLTSIAALQSLPGVVAVHASRTFELDNIPGVQYIEANDAWNETGRTGNGVKIAVLDTGVDYFHANLGGAGNPAHFSADNHTTIEPGSFPTAKVVAGTDFVGDNFDASSDDPAENTPQPDPDPVDCNGHGSHVSGSAAGNGVLADGTTFTGPYDGSTYSSNSFRIGPGVAPKASIIAVRVFGCTGSTSEAVLVAALNYASAQGADVVNMSLGSPFGRDEEPSTVASNDIAEDGVVVVASAGNEGASAYITGAPAVASRAISVAAIDSFGPTFPGASVDLMPGAEIDMINANESTFANGTSLAVAVLRTSYPSGPVSLGCDPAEYAGFPGGVSGKLVVTVRGVCARVARAVFGQQAGAAAVAMINTSAVFPPFEGEITSNPDTGEKFTVTIPFLGVRGVLGPAATPDGDDLIAASTVTLTNKTLTNNGYQRLAGFTSGGPANADSDPKPEVTAPGVSVKSTLVGSGNNGTRISGTSMAAPHTAGVAALVTEAHPTWSTELIKSAIVHTADASAAKIIGTGVSSYDPRRAGSGVVDARKAVDSVGLATTDGGKATLAYGYESLGGAYTEMLPLTLHNTSGSAITYNLTSAFVGSTRGTAVAFSANPVTVAAGGSQTVNITLSLTPANVAALPEAAASNFGGLVNVRGVIVATPTTTGAGVYALRVPFILAPRGLSAIGAGPKSAYTRSGSTFTANVPLNNTGIRSGTADVYAWGISDGNDIASFTDDPMDIRAVGVQALPGSVLGGPASDRTLVFAINGWGRWSNPSVNEFDILIDVKGDAAPEFFVVGVDLGAVLAGSFNGQFASFIFDASGNLINAWVAIAPMNGSTVLLPTLASDIGMDPSVNSQTKFRYRVAGFSIVPGGLVDTTGVAEFRSHQPSVSTGDFLTVAPGASTSVSVTVDKAKFGIAPQLGWMVVTHDDANGGPQADLIPVGDLN